MHCHAFLGFFTSSSSQFLYVFPLISTWKKIGATRVSPSPGKQQQFMNIYAPPPKAPPPKKLRTYSITKQLSRCPAKKTKIRTYVLILGWPCGLARAFNYVAVIRQYVLILERSKNEICPYFGIFLEACKSFRIFLIVGHNKTICSYFGRVQQWEVKQVVFHQTLIGWSA